MPGPGGRGWACPLLSSEPRGFPARCGHNSGERGHLARRDLCPSPAGLQPPAQWPPEAPSRLNHSFPHPLNSWCFQGNYLMNQQCGDCGGGMAQNGTFSQHQAHRARRAPAGQQSPLHASPTYPQHPAGQRNLDSGRPGCRCQSLLGPLPAVWPYTSGFSAQPWFFSCRRTG